MEDVVWDPARDLLVMQEQLDSLFGRAASGWLPAAELTECPERYVLTIEMPGLAREDVRLEFRGQDLVVSGQRPGVDCPQRYHQLERGHGAFSRVFSFTQPIDADAVHAALASGVLTVTVPKRHRTDAARRIDVS